MHGVDLHGGAAAGPVSLLANPVHFSRIRSSTIALCLRSVHTAEVLRQLLDRSRMESDRLQPNACI